MSSLKILKEKIKADPKISKLIKELKFKDEEIIRYSFWLDDYFIDKATCDRCAGLKYCPKELKYQEVALHNEGSKLYRGITDCKYLREVNNSTPANLLASNCKDYLIRKLKIVNSKKWNNCFDTSSKKMVMNALHKESEVSMLWFYNKTVSSVSSLLVRFLGACENEKMTSVYIKTNLPDKKWLIKHTSEIKKCDVLFVESFLSLSVGNPWEFFDLVEYFYQILEYRIDRNKLCVFSSFENVDNTFKNKINKIDSIFKNSEYKKNMLSRKTTLENLFDLIKDVSIQNNVVFKKLDK